MNTSKMTSAYLAAAFLVTACPSIWANDFEDCEDAGLAGTITITDSELNDIPLGSTVVVDKTGQVNIGAKKAEKVSCEYDVTNELFIVRGNVKISKCWHQFTIQQDGGKNDRIIYFTDHDDGNKCAVHKDENYTQEHRHLSNGDFHGGTAHGGNG